MILSLGFSGILEASEHSRASKSWDDEQEHFFEGIKITYTAIVALIERLAELAEQTPIGRLGTPSDVAQASVFLAEASFVTGQVLSVDGGFLL